MVQVRLVLVPDDYLEVAVCNLLVSGHDNSNHEVKHNDLQEVSLAEEDEPNQVDVDVNVNTQLVFAKVVLFKKSTVAWKSQLTNGIPKGFKQRLLEVSED